MFAQNSSLKGNLLSIEGISGCGKTYLLNLLKNKCPEAIFVAEASDRKHARLDRHILAGLQCTDDQFFRTGHARTETVLLIALKTFDFESCCEPGLLQNKVVWEDRSLDSIAVYQSILNHPHNVHKW